MAGILINMIIYRAVKSNNLCQTYYQNLLPSLYASLGMKYHGGWDWATYYAEPLYFDCDIKGFVLNTEIDNAGGLGINIITEDESGIFKHRYWHLKSFNVVAGQWVESGDLLGWCDSTGYSTGNHLHSDIKEMIKENGVYKIKNYNNGTFGTVDIQPYFKNIFVKDLIDNLNQQVSILKRLVDLVKQLIGK